MLDKYKINSNGKLMLKKKEFEDKDEEKLEEKAKEEGYGSFQEMLEEDMIRAFRLGQREVKDEWWEEFNHTTTIEFYASPSSPRNESLKHRYEYKAVFEQGILKDISLIKKR